ncbi:MAG: hydrogenase maturation nickel metallochaperone HypA [Actinomycetota bacterium]|nr:hydrogenase maturation nickel metallochaperone HypA [Actinomycetota bacterium]
MHELAIAEAVMKIAGEHAANRRVTKVELKVGHLRQVVPSALEFAFTLVAEGTAVEGAELVIEQVPATVRCSRCRSESQLDGFPVACPRCASVDVELVGGEELAVEALELEEEWTDGADGVAAAAGARGGDR